MIQDLVILELRVFILGVGFPVMHEKRLQIGFEFFYRKIEWMLGYIRGRRQHCLIVDNLFG